MQSFCIVTLAGVFLGAIRLAFRQPVRGVGGARRVELGAGRARFHASVSGIRFDAPDYRTVERGPDWLTGGRGGRKAASPRRSACSAVLAYLHRTRRRRREES